MSDIGDSQMFSMAIIRDLVEDLFSYNTVRRKRALEYYFFPNATLSSPIMCTEGVMNIQYVYTVWQTVNRKEPIINNIVFDGQTAVIHLTQTISPCLFPNFVQVQFPSITTLRFKETEKESGLLKVYEQEDSWTLEGLLQSVPLISFWYDHVVRLTMGKLVTSTGDLLDTAIQQAEKLSVRKQQIQRIGRELALENIEKLDEYKTELHAGYIKSLQHWRKDQI
ncbi:hypothetical protein BY458DRAFT_560844 [Sporodiniella umbellata]|nr:hypothetical protein BY458DRAFT_560844 [Sporodiniella umbellata]